MPAVGLAMVSSDSEDPTAEKPSDGFGLGSVLLLRAHKLTLARDVLSPGEIGVGRQGIEP
jgi:hypothetical protein